MRQPKSVDATRGGTGEAAWKGAGASILLHLFVGGAVIAGLSGPPNATPRVIDLALLAPAATVRPPAPSAFVRAAGPAGPGRTVLPELPTSPASPLVTDPPGETPPERPPTPVAGENAFARGDSAPPVGSPASISPAPAGEGPYRAAPGGPPAQAGAGPAADFAWIREAIQHAIAYPATARRMGWEGRVVVAFRLLPDGSVRDVRVVHGSGHAALDRGAIDAVRTASPFPRSPLEAEVITPIVYRLTTR